MFFLNFTFFQTSKAFKIYIYIYIYILVKAYSKIKVILVINEVKLDLYQKYLIQIILHMLRDIEWMSSIRWGRGGGVRARAPSPACARTVTCSSPPVASARTSSDPEPDSSSALGPCQRLLVLIWPEIIRLRKVGNCGRSTINKKRFI